MMNDKKVAKKIIRHKAYILKPLKARAMYKLNQNLQKQVKMITKIMFSDIPHKVDKKDKNAKYPVKDYGVNHKLVTLFWVTKLPSNMYVASQVMRRRNAAMNLINTVKNPTYNTIEKGYIFLYFLENTYFQLLGKVRQYKTKAQDTTFESRLKAIHRFNDEANPENKYLVIKCHSLIKKNKKQKYHEDIINVVSYVQRSLVDRQTANLLTLAYRIMIGIEQRERMMK